ncbi:MAG: hypothetical protein M0Q53_15925 [Prolixibacteraceae bacterium]|jgi:hypothetical protein|nr:hypothetical protein [Prolixibacteraceae bacterium]
MKSLFVTSVVILAFLLVCSCQKEHESDSNGKLLSFSTDTVAFDTIFTSIGSPTKNLRVYNSTNDRIIVSSIRLAGGENSGFRLNINGEATNEISNVEIPARDSIFIFVEATLNRLGVHQIMVAEDSILFKLNSKEQKVRLVAWGQDFKLIRSEMIKTTTWTKEKPYLIYGYAYVDSCQKLSIDPGCNIYFHKNAGLFIKGSLVVKGTTADPVVFKGDRLETGYANLPDQWHGITLLSGSHNNIIDHSIIKNANIGLQVGNIEKEGYASVTLSNTRIENMSWSGIWAMKSKILAYNCVIANIGYYNTALLLGGDYQFYHTTFANYNTDYFKPFRNAETLTLSNYLVNSTNGTKYVGELTQAVFGNCIISGMNPDELKISMDRQGKSNYLFDHCLIQISDTFKLPNPDRFVSLQRNINPRFINPQRGIFELDTLSVAKDVGKEAIAKIYPTDLKGVDRNSDAGADLGAFERIEKKK